jgi:hypothetical protein
MAPRSFITRVLSLGPRAQRPDHPSIDERVAIVARLLPGSRDRAADIIAEGPPYGLALAGFRRHSVFLADEAVVFVFAGPRVEGLVRRLVNDRARSAAFSAWAPLLDGTPVLAREEFHWEAGQAR